jgi:alkylhydroperoxidase family enzyme
VLKEELVHKVVVLPNCSPLCVARHRRRNLFLTDGLGDRESAEEDAKLGKLSKDVLAMHQITLMIVNHPDILQQLTQSLNRTEDEWRAAGNVRRLCLRVCGMGALFVCGCVCVR